MLWWEQLAFHKPANRARVVDTCVLRKHRIGAALTRLTSKTSMEKITKLTEIYFQYLRKISVKWWTRVPWRHDVLPSQMFWESQIPKRGVRDKEAGKKGVACSSSHQHNKGKHSNVCHYLFIIGVYCGFIVDPLVVNGLGNSLRWSLCRMENTEI